MKKIPIGTRVFMEIAVDGISIGKIHFGLYDTQCPRAVENFKRLCEGVIVDGEIMHYKSSKISIIIPNFAIQGGSLSVNGKSVFGARFSNDIAKIPFNKPFLLTMSACGSGSLSTEFLFTLSPTDWLEMDHVPFGEVVDGKDVIEELVKLGSECGEFSNDVVIADCGILS